LATAARNSCVVPPPLQRNSRFDFQHQTILDANPRSRGADSARGVQELIRPENRGRGECRVPAAPAAPRAMKKAHGRSRREVTGTPGIPARNGFNGFLRALLGDRAFLSPSSALVLADLTPASRRQDHTTSPSASARFVKRAARVHRIPCPTSVTIAIRPSTGTGLVRSIPASTNLESKKFTKWDWTGKSPDSLSGQIRRPVRDRSQGRTA
jgi:hypothetical protein